MKTLVQLIWIVSLNTIMLVASDDVNFTLNDMKMNVRIPSNADEEPTLVPRLIASKIRDSLLDGLIKDAQVTISSAILSESVDLYFEWAGVSEQSALRLNTKLSRTVDALKAVVQNGDAPQEAYDNYLRDLGSIDIEEWSGWLDLYDNKEKIDQLERSIPKSLGEMKSQSTDSLKRDLQTIVLMDQWVEGVAPTGEDIDLAYREMYPTGNPPLAEVKAEVVSRASRDVRREHLIRRWKEEVRKQEMAVPERYEDDVYRYVEEVPSPILPNSILKVLRESNGLEDTRAKP